MQVYQKVYAYIKAYIQNNKNTIKLPTERALSQELGVSRGSVKRAYDSLESEGVIRRIQGSGTVVVPTKASPQSFSEQIDQATEELYCLNLPYSTIVECINTVLLTTLQSSRTATRLPFKLAWIECCSEFINETVQKISEICNINTTGFLITEIKNNPQLLTEGKFDFIATNIEHYDEILHCTSTLDIDIQKTIFPLSKQTAIELANFNQYSKIAILYRSHAFENVAVEYIDEYYNMKNCDTYCINNESDIQALSAIITSYNALLTPPEYSAESLNAMLNLQITIPTIPFSCFLDNGTIAYLQEMINNKILE